MREYLVTKFACTQCGGLLQLSYDRPKLTPVSNGEPTGAAMVQSVIGVVPCRICIEPANQAKQAISRLLELGGLKPVAPDAPPR